MYLLVLYSLHCQSNANNSIVITSNPVIDSNSASNVYDDNIVQSSSSSDSLGSLISLVSCDGHAPSLISWYKFADLYNTIAWGQVNQWLWSPYLTKEINWHAYSSTSLCNMICTEEDKLIWGWPPQEMKLFFSLSPKIIMNCGHRAWKISWNRIFLMAVDCSRNT